MKIWHGIICVFALSAGMVMAADLPSAERGKKLFTSPMLGTNGKSCASCHSQGKLLEDIGTYDDPKLELITNQCIFKALDGAPLPIGSPDLTSLVMYLKTLVATAAK